MTVQNTAKKRVVVAMSGGVDSSVCAYLLKRDGYEPVGVTIKTWGSDECRDERSKGCCSIRDIEDARSVARKLDIPYYVMDLSADFKEKVVDYFVDEYLTGRTPNPCIECNRTIKFGLLLEKARELEAEFVATGHYARKGYDEADKMFHVREGADLSKDQSYVLFGLDQRQLSRVLLPVGELMKTEVRRIAESLGLRVFDKPDSQEICFVSKKYGDFINQAAPKRVPGRGLFVDSSGRSLGEHEGFHLYTVGQRKRIGMNFPEGAYFVTAVDAARNEVILGTEDRLLTREMEVDRVNWMSIPRLKEICVKIRSRHSKTRARIDRIQADTVRVVFDEPQKAVTPGQAAVFYDQDRVIGGGWIRSGGGSQV